MASEPNFKAHWATTWADDLDERAEILREDALELAKRDSMARFVANDLRQAALRLDAAAGGMRALARKGTT